MPAHLRSSRHSPRQGPDRIRPPGTPPITAPSAPAAPATATLPTAIAPPTPTGLPGPFLLVLRAWQRHRLPVAQPPPRFASDPALRLQHRPYCSCLCASGFDSTATITRALPAPSCSSSEPEPVPLTFPAEILDWDPLTISAHFRRSPASSRRRHRLSEGKETMPTRTIRR